VLAAHLATAVGADRLIVAGKTPGVFDASGATCLRIDAREARVMVEAGRGRIINIASVSGQLGGHRRAAYGASKGGVIMLTRTMSTELAPLGITVNAIAPGPIDTPMTSAMDGTERATWLARLPMHRYGTPAEVAAAALFLASDEASFVTGHVLNVDGGFAAAGIFTPPE